MSRSSPDNEYYDRPYLPSQSERSDWDTLPLRPTEALFLLVNNSGDLSDSDKRALNKIIDDDDNPDVGVDLFSLTNDG